MEKILTCIDKAYIFIRWIINVYPEICNEYFETKLYKELSNDCLKISIDKMHILLENT